MSALPSPLEPLPNAGGGGIGVAAAEARLRASGVEPITWSNGPDERYAAHQHRHAKLLVCAAGSITFLIGEGENPVELNAGDGFILPAATMHAAVVGPAGCTCVEGHRQ